MVLANTWSDHCYLSLGSCVTVLRGRFLAQGSAFLVKHGFTGLFSLPFAALPLLGLLFLRRTPGKIKGLSFLRRRSELLKHLKESLSELVTVVALGPGVFSLTDSDS